MTLAHDVVGASQLHALPDEILVLIATELASSRRLASLASLCSMSKSHYHLFRPHLYRRFLLTDHTSLFFADLLRELPHIVEDLQDDDRFEELLADMTISGKPRVGYQPKDLYTSAVERSHLVQDLVIESLPCIDVRDALAQLRLSSFIRERRHGPDTTFSMLRRIIITEACTRYMDKEMEEDCTTAQGMLRGMSYLMSPEHICIHYYPFDDEVDTRSNNIENTLCEIVYGLESSPRPVNSISAHNVDGHGIPDLDYKGVVDVYLPRRRDLLPEPNSIAGAEHILFRLTGMLLCDSADLLGKSSRFRIYHTLEEETLAYMRGKEEVERLRDIDLEQSAEQVAQEFAFQTMGSYGITLDMDAEYRNKFLDLWKEHWTKTIEYSPSPPMGAKCEHCHVAI